MTAPQLNPHHCHIAKPWSGHNAMLPWLCNALLQPVCIGEPLDCGAVYATMVPQCSAVTAKQAFLNVASCICYH